MTGMRGATIFEVLVVVGVIAVVAALGWHADPLAARLALRAAASTLAGNLRAAQARAMAERRNDRAHGIEIRPGSDRYVVFVREGTVRVPLREERLPLRVRITYARFGGSPPTIVMFTGVSLLGAPSGGGTVTLASGGARLCVRVAPATGRVRVAATNCP